MCNARRRTLNGVGAVSANMYDSSRSWFVAWQGAAASEACLNGEGRRPRWQCGTGAAPLQSQLRPRKGRGRGVNVGVVSGMAARARCELGDPAVGHNRMTVGRPGERERG